ncbi:YjgF-like protein [Thozetella sp. PMI_491]|nr:YjgF-like protein [Thozetella sp. PMI_491]
MQYRRPDDVEPILPPEPVASSLPCQGSFRGVERQLKRAGEDSLSSKHPVSFTPLNPFGVTPGSLFNAQGIVFPAGHNIIVTSGQVGTTDAAGTIPDSYEEQVDAAIRNLALVLAEAGATPADIIKLTYYIFDFDISIGSVHAVALQQFLKGQKPATTLVGVAKLAHPKLKFEIEAIAAVKPRHGQRAISARLA